MTCAVLLLAAGRSTRMRGQDKLLRPVGGVPLVRVMAERCLQTGLPVWITLPPGSDRSEHLTGLHLDAVEIDGPMGTSIAAGLRAMPSEISHAIIVLADMPEITAADISAIAEAASGSANIWRATTQDGEPGHPVALPARLFGQIIGAAPQDRGPSWIMKSEVVRHIALPGHAARTDLDTPEDWSAWEKQNSSA